jgi:hypothetical protein
MGFAQMYPPLFVVGMVCVRKNEKRLVTTSLFNLIIGDLMALPILAPIAQVPVEAIVMIY